MTPNMRPMNGTPQSAARSCGATTITIPDDAARTAHRAEGRRSVSAGVCRLVGGVVAVCVVGLGVGACAPSSGGIEAVSGAQSTVERQMSGEYILNPDGTLSKIPVFVHEPELQSNAYTYSAFGAEQAAKHYLALVAYGWETGDTQPMKDFATDECDACSEMVTRVNDLYTSGGWAHGLKYTVVSVDHVDEVLRIDNVDNSYGVIMTVDTEGGDAYLNGELGRGKSAHEQLVMLLHWSGEQWQVIGISTVDPEE